MCRKGIARLKKIYQWLIWQIIEVLKLRNDDMGYRQISCFVKTVVVVALVCGVFLKMFAISEARVANIRSEGAEVYQYFYLLNKYGAIEDVYKVDELAKWGNEYYTLMLYGNFNLEAVKNKIDELQVKENSVVRTSKSNIIYVAKIKNGCMYIDKRKL